MRGALIVAQSGGPSPVLNASLAGALAEARKHDCFSAVYGLVRGIEGALNEELLDLSDVPDGALDALVQTPGAALGSGRFKIGEGDFERVLRVFRAHDARYFAYIGGNGSMYVCDRLAALDPDLRVMGIPKTIDNDLAGTDHAPGYGSAARFMALATRDAGLDLEAMATFDDIILLESMGRNSGWLAAASALLKTQADEAPHLVYVPEIPFDEARFLDDIRRVHDRLGYAFVVVGEGVRDAAGNFVGHDERKTARDVLGRVLHSFSAGAGTYLGDLVRERLQLKARVLRPSTIGRSLSACISDVDQREAWGAGAEAVRRLAAGDSGQMITLERDPTRDAYAVRFGGAALADVASHEKLLPRDFMDDSGTMPSQRFYDYALPLIGTLPPPPARLAVRRVARRLSM